MKAWKFLAEGAVGPFTGFRWPAPDGGAGAWVTAPEGAAEDRWIHACRLRDLPCWFGEELWELELAAPIAQRPHQIAAPRGRLVRRIAGWDRASADALARACAERAGELAARAPAEHRDSAEAYRDAVLRYAEKPAVVTFATALLAELVAGPGGRDAERAWQARWLAERLALSE